MRIILGILLLVSSCTTALDLPGALESVDGGEVLAPDAGPQPCTPNPCSEANRQQCSVDETGQAQCDCDDGYQLNGQLCLPHGSETPGEAGCGDDEDSCMAGAIILTRGVPYEGSLGDAEDQVDYFILAAPSRGGVEQFTVSVDEGAQPTVEIYVFPAESPLLRAAEASLAVEVNAGDQLLVAVLAAGEQLQSYTLQADNLGVDDHGDTVMAASEVTSGAHSFRLETNTDVDVFQVNDFAVDTPPQQPSSILLRAELDEGQQPLSLQLRVGPVDRVGEFAYLGSARHPVDQAGAYAVKLRALEGQLLSGTLHILALDGDDHGDSSDWATDLQVRRAISAELAADDEDWFRLRAVGSQVYRVTLGGAPGRNIEVFSPADRLRWSLQHAGVYYVHGPLDSDAFLKVSGASGAYTLTVEDRELQDEAGGGEDEALPLNPGEVFPAAIQFLGDQDRFLFPAFPTGGCWTITLAEGRPEVKLTLILADESEVALGAQEALSFQTAFGESAQALVEAAPGQQVEEPLNYSVLGTSVDPCP